MKAEIVRALEEGTWAELRVRDWDLRGAAQRWHRFCALVCSRPYRLTGIAIDGPAWKGLLAAMNAGVPTGLRLGGRSRGTSALTRPFAAPAFGCTTSPELCTLIA